LLSDYIPDATFPPMPNNNDAYDEALRKIGDSIERNVDRASQRASQLDRILITLSAGALVFSIHVVNTLPPCKHILPVLFLSWVCFFVAMILVILAIRSEQKSIERQIKKASEALNLLEKDPTTARNFLRSTPFPISTKQVEQNRLIGHLNNWALVAFVAGILLLAIFTGSNL
jgi:hypothetical protein